METHSATPIVRDYYDIHSSELYRVSGIYHGAIECICSTTWKPQYAAGSRARSDLAVDPANSDAIAYLAAAERALV